MHDLEREEKEKFHFKKVTQSEYRGGRSNIKAEEKYLDCMLSKVTLTKDSDKKKLKNRITEEFDHILSVLLPEDLQVEVKNGPVYTDIYKRLGL